MAKSIKSDYWLERSARRVLRAEKQSIEAQNNVIGIYEQSLRNVKKLLEEIEKRYSDKTGLSQAELKKLLKGSDRYNFLKSVEKNIKELGLNVEDVYKPGYLDEINRLDAIKQQLNWEIQAIAPKQISAVEPMYRDVVRSAYKETSKDIRGVSGVRSAFGTVDNGVVDDMLKEKWVGGNWSSRIWTNNDKFAGEIRTIIGGGMTSGTSLNKIAKQITDKYGAEISSSMRLARTEANYFRGQAELQSYKDDNIEWYQYEATLDNRTSSFCDDETGIHGNVYRVDEAQVGENYPPLHPNCRSTTTAVFRDDLKKLKAEGKYSDKKAYHRADIDRAESIADIDKAYNEYLANKADNIDMNDIDTFSEVVDKELSGTSKYAPVGSRGEYYGTPYEYVRASEIGEDGFGKEYTLLTEDGEIVGKRTVFEDEPSFVPTKLIDEWTKGVDYQAKLDAYYAMTEGRDVEATQAYLRYSHFGADYKRLKEVPLFRVGGFDDGVLSFFTDEKGAKAYQKRMGVDSIHRYTADMEDVFPVLSGAGEVWVSSDNIRVSELEKQPLELAIPMTTGELEKRWGAVEIDKKAKINPFDTKLKQGGDKALNAEAEWIGQRAKFTGDEEVQSEMVGRLDEIIAEMKDDGQKQQVKMVKDYLDFPVIEEYHSMTDEEMLDYYGQFLPSGIGLDDLTSRKDVYGILEKHRKDLTPNDEIMTMNLYDLKQDLKSGNEGAHHFQSAMRNGLMRSKIFTGSDELVDDEVYSVNNLNGKLRYNREILLTGNHEDSLEKYDRVIEKSKLKVDKEFYRGVRHDDWDIEFTEGMEFEDKGYPYVTNELSTAIGYSGSKGSIMTIQLREGDNLLNGMQFHGGAYENILPRNTKFKVTKVVKIENKPDEITLDIVR